MSPANTESPKRNAAAATVNDPFANAHNADLEAAVLAVLLDGRHAEAYGLLAEHCPDLDAFWNRNNRIVALGIHQVAGEGARVSAQTVSEHLARLPFQEAMDLITPEDERRHATAARPKLKTEQYEESALAAVGGISALADMAAISSPVVSMERNCRHLARFLRQRRAIKAMSQAIGRLQAVNGSTHAEEIASEVSNALSTAVGKGRTSMSVSEGATSMLAQHDHAQAQRVAGGAQRLGSWGVPSLDEACPIEPGILIMLAALPGAGKTSLMLQAAKATRDLHGGAAVGLLTWEIPNDRLAAILLAREIGVHAKVIKRGWMGENERAAYLKAMESWKTDDIPTMGEGDRTMLADVVAWIRLQHRRSAGKLLLVAVDYIQLLPGSNKRQNEFERITEVSHTLRRLKNELGICILALSQFNRDTSKEGGRGAPRAPRASDLKGSGALEADADAIVILHPDGEGGDVQRVNALIPKNRGDRTFPKGIPLEFNKRAGQTFTPPLPVGPPQPENQTRWERMQSKPHDGEEAFGGEP